MDAAALNQINLLVNTHYEEDQLDRSLKRSRLSLLLLKTSNRTNTPGTRIPTDPPGDQVHPVRKDT